MRSLLQQRVVASRRSLPLCTSFSRRQTSTKRAATKSTTSNESTSSQDSKLVNAPPVRGRDDDVLSRFPNLNTPGGMLRGLDYAGTVTFAITGRVTAAQAGLDVFGCSMVGMITAVGGGTIRDAIFLNTRPFWCNETEYIWMSCLAGFITFFSWPFVLDWQLGRQKEQQQQRQQRLSKSRTTNTPSDETTTDDNMLDGSYYDELDAVLDTLDAVGLSAFAIIGAQNGVRAGMPMVVSAICGMATSTFGGLTRDVLCGRPVRIVHSNAETYAPLALAGATTYLAARRINASPGVRIGSALAVCMGSRFFAIRHDVKLHTWDTKNDGLGVAVRK